MGRSDSRSRNKHRLDGISDVLEVLADPFDGEGFSEHVSVNCVLFSEKSSLASQVSEYPSFDHSGEASNIFTNDPSGPDFVNNSQHFRPEVTLVVSPTPFSSIGKRLAGKSSGKDVNSSAPLSEICFRDVFITD